MKAGKVHLSGGFADLVVQNGDNDNWDNTAGNQRMENLKILEL